MEEDDLQGFIVEFISLGQAMKVIAIDPVSQREVSIVGNPRETRRQLAKIAIDKLKYVMTRDASKQSMDE